jgi:hypothetical protein
VPYKIKLHPFDVNIRVSNTNSARRYVVINWYDSKLHEMGQSAWTREPETLPNDDVYARMSPAEVVTAYFDALSKPDWVALEKLTTEADAEEHKRAFAEAEAKGEDPRELVPTVEVGEAVWSAEEMSYFVKCRVTHFVERGQFALRRDENGKRWKLEGGF